MDEYIAAVSLKLSRAELEKITQIRLEHRFRWWGREFLAPEDRS
jgi:hypothetical protein